MDKNGILKQIYKFAKAGEFDEILRLAKDVEFNSESALNVLIHASHACYNKTESVQRNENNICKMCECVVPYIILNESQLELYMKSIFHLLKVLIDAGNYEDLGKIEFAIVPEFLNKFDLKILVDSKYIYQQLVSRIANSICTLAKAKNTSKNEHILSVLKIAIQANIKINNIENQLMLSKKLLHAVDYLEFDIKSMAQFYVLVMESLKFERNNCTDNELSLIFENLSVVLSIIIKQVSYEFAEEFLIMAMKFSFSELYVKALKLFGVVTSLLPMNIQRLPFYLGNMRQLIDHMSSNSDITYRIMALFEEPIYLLLTYYKTEGCDMWCSLAPKGLQVLLLFLREYVLKYWVDNHRLLGACNEEKYFNTLKISCHVHKLIKNYIEKNNDLPQETYEEVLKWLEYNFYLVKELKRDNCEKWEEYFKNLVSYYNNMCVTLYHQKNKFYVKIYEELIKQFVEFEYDTGTIIKHSLKEKSFHLVCDMYFKAGDYISCMAYAAIHCLLYIQDSTSLFQSWWIRAKIKMRQDVEVHSQTLLDVLRSENSLIKAVVDTKKLLTKEKIVQLLTFELTNYSEIYNSKILIVDSFCQFIQVADLPDVAKVVLLVFGSGDNMIYEKLPEVFENLERQFENAIKTNSSPCYKMALSVLLYYKYRFITKETAKKCSEEIARNEIVTKSAKEKFEPVPEDANDDCDVVTTYSNLTIDNFIEVIGNLVKAIEYMEAVSEDTFKIKFISNATQLLIKIGFDFRLNCYSLNSLRAFKLALKYAEKISDNESKLLCIAFLIELSNPSKKLIKDLISEGDTLVKMLQATNEKENNGKTVLIYFISKAKAFLYQDSNLAYEAWQTAHSMMEMHSGKDDFGFLQAELYILDFKLTKACRFIVGEHKRNPMTIKLHYALDVICDLTSKDGTLIGSYERCIIFDTVYELTKVYLLMRLPRDLRCYAKNTLILTQKLLLPMQCVSFLILLAHSDLLTCKLDSCNVKLNGINDIFLLNHSTTNEKDIDFVTTEIRELALDQKRNSSLSPLPDYLPVNSFKLPEFLQHDADCTCFFCMSYEYQLLVLEKFHLEALIHMYKEDSGLADNFIKGAITIYKTLEKKYENYFTKATQLVSQDLVSDFKDYFLESYGNILCDYSYHLSRTFRETKALEINNYLINILQPRKLELVHLYSEALLQKRRYIAPDSPSQPNEDSKIGLSVTPTRDNIEVSTTPHNKKSMVTVQINSNYKISPPKQRLKTKAVLFTSPCDTQLKLVPSPVLAPAPLTPKVKLSKKTDDLFSIEKSKPKGSRVQLFSTPVPGNIQTPKINIFTEDDGSLGSAYKPKRRQTTNKKQSKGAGEPNPNSTRKSRTTRSKILSEDIQTNLEVQENKPSSDHQVPPPAVSKVLRMRAKAVLETHPEPNQNEPTTSRGLRKYAKGNLLSDKITVPLKVPSENNERGDRSDQIFGLEHNNLQTRSKLLLEKLKNSTRKIREDVDDPSPARTRGRAKKNLLNQF